MRDLGSLSVYAFSHGSKSGKRAGTAVARSTKQTISSECVVEISKTGHRGVEFWDYVRWRWANAIHYSNTPIIESMATWESR